VSLVVRHIKGKICEKNISGKIHEELRMRDKINLMSLDRRFPWSLLGFLAGLIFGLFGIYSVFFYTKAPDLRAEIESSTPVFSLRENVKDLKIIFKGQDIKQAHKELTLINLKLINRGNIPIKPGDFDQKDPLTLFLQNGEIIKADILETSDSYLKKVFADTRKNPQCIQFPPFIMEPDQYLSIRLLTLHTENAAPTLIVTGKIANVRNVPVIGIASDERSPSKLTLAFSGDFVVQFIRVFVYGISTLGAIIGLILLYGTILDRRNRRSQRHMSMRIGEFLLSLSEDDRLALEPIAEVLLRDKDLRHKLRAKLDCLFPLNTGSLNNYEYDRLIAELGRIVPGFNPGRFMSDKKRITHLCELLDIVDNI